MFDQTFSYVLAIAALVIGVMLLTGHGFCVYERWEYSGQSTEI